MILDEVHVISEGTNGVMDVIVESSAHILDEVYVHRDDTSDMEHTLMESSAYIGSKIGIMLVIDMGCGY